MSVNRRIGRVVCQGPRSLAAAVGLVLLACSTAAAAKPDTAVTTEWNQWGGSPSRNNTPISNNVPIEWEPGDFDYDTGEWQSDTSTNVLWAAPLGSQTYGNPVIAG